MRRSLALLALAMAMVMTGAPVRAAGWQPPAGLQQQPIWPGIPPSGNITRLPERVETKTALVAGRPWTAVFDVTTPTMTVFPPKGPNRHAAIVVLPGGGFTVLAVDLERTEICDWAAARGITCVLLKYRVPKSGEYWDAGCRCHVTPQSPRALQDAQRTIRLVRARSRELDVDPKKIGVIGMSAGGYLVAQTSNIFAPAYRPVDAVDTLSSRPDFAIALYPGHLCQGDGRLTSTLRVVRNAPPTFLLQAWDDPVDDVCNSIAYARALHSAGVAAEVHLFAKGGHAFGLRRTSDSITAWPNMVQAWLKGLAIL